jgi:GNAT superfamily N-acetyltransferase
MQYTIHKFHPEESMAYRTIRLEALKSEPGFFGNSYGTEAEYPLEFWRDYIESPLRGIFGLYGGEELVGLTSIFCTSEKPGEGYLTQSYIRKPHRGKGLSAMLYNARIAWALEAGLKCLIVGHRASNFISKAANQRYGFCYSHREPRHWPDGSEDDMLYYKLMLDTIPTQELNNSYPVSGICCENMVRYFRAMPADAETVVELRIEVLFIFQGMQTPEAVAILRPHLLETVARGLEDGTYVCWLAEKKGTIVSSGGMAIRRQPGNFGNPEGRKGYIMSMYTKPEYRGQGICSKLVQRLIQSGKEVGIKHFELHSTKAGEPVYKNLGFKIHDEPTYRKSEI